MFNLEDIEIYLPKFLSASSEKELFSGLRDFPDNIDERFYSLHLKDTKVIFQGDGIREMLIVNLPDKEVRPAPGMILSNTCDIDPDNQRHFSSQIVYAPIFNLEKYKKTLLKSRVRTEESITNHIQAIKRQEITQIFYLPKYYDKLEESIVFFDRVNNVSINWMDRNNVYDKRVFTLSNYGIYVFLLKLSIHFTRIKDNVDR